MTIKQTNLTIRPKLGRSCRCMKIRGHGYESVVECVSILNSVISIFFIFSPFFIIFFLLFLRQYWIIGDPWGTWKVYTGPWLTTRDHKRLWLIKLVIESKVALQKSGGSKRSMRGLWGTIGVHGGPYPTMEDQRGP